MGAKQGEQMSDTPRADEAFQQSRNGNFVFLYHAAIQLERELARVSESLKTLGEHWRESSKLARELSAELAECKQKKPKEEQNEPV